MTYSGRRAHLPCGFAIALIFTLSASAGFAGDVFGTRKGKVYHTHFQECASARKIGGDNRVTFSNAQEAMNAGRRLCKRCESLDKKAAESGEARGDQRKGGGQPPKDEGRTGAEPGGREPAGPVRPVVPPQEGEEASIEIAAVMKVLTGGTLVLDNGEHAVLVGVSCPTLKKSGGGDVQRFMTEQTRGRMVRLTCDATTCFGARRDELGRLLVYAVPEPDGRDLGAELIFQGFAWVDLSVPFSRQADYLRNEEAAWRAGRGVWKIGSEKSAGVTVVTGRHARCYHSPNCRHVPLLTGTMSLTLDEAKSRRLVPCSDYR